MDDSAILYPDGWHWEKTELTYGVDPAMAAWSPWINAAMKEWDLACGLSLAPAAAGTQADIQVSTLATVGAPSNALGWGGFWTADTGTAIVHGFVGLESIDPGTLPVGKALWMALHEVGHALGLSHPYQGYLGNAGDQSETVMSYVAAPDGGIPDGPMPVDVAAVQALYGPDRVVYAAAAGEATHGGPGDDELHGGNGADALYGMVGGDAMYGHPGDDLLFGGQGDDTLFGGQGDDTLFGGQGDDTLFGGLGDDALAGGLGADVFVIGPGGGHDTILDFDAAAGDRLRLFDGAAPVVVAVAGGARIDLADGTTVTLAGVDPAHLPPDWYAVG